MWVCGVGGERHLQVDVRSSPLGKGAHRKNSCRGRPFGPSSNHLAVCKGRLQRVSRLYTSLHTDASQRLEYHFPQGGWGRGGGQCAGLCTKLSLPQPQPENRRAETACFNQLTLRVLAPLPSSLQLGGRDSSRLFFASP